jgi:hypothetical protein
MKNAIVASVLLAAAGFPAYAQTAMPLNQPPTTSCPDLQAQQRETRYKLDHTGYGDARDQLRSNLYNIEYHLRTDCFGQ